MNLQDKPETARNSDPKINALLELAIEAVDELKGESVQVLDVADLTTIADHMVICSGRSARHVKRLGETVIAHAKDAGIQPRVEGLSQAEWVLIDLNGVVVHIMQPVTRAYYQLEKLWDMDAIAAESSTTH